MPLIKKKNNDDDNLKKAKMKAKMAIEAHFGNKSAQRMVSANPKTTSFKDDEGYIGKGTHYMAYMGNYAVPILQENKNGNLAYNKNASPLDKEAIRFDTEEDAAYFAENYKKVAPMMRQQEYIDKAAKEKETLKKGRFKKKSK